MGFAHSVEVWLDEALVGGLYGVALRAAFFGESMFTRKSDASKIALVHLMARLRHGRFLLLDAQFTNEHLQQFGITEIDRADFQDRLADALFTEADLALEIPSAQLVIPFLNSLTNQATSRRHKQEASDHKPDAQVPIPPDLMKKSSLKKSALVPARYSRDHEWL